MGRLTRVGYPDGSTVDYVYDALGNRLVKATAISGSPSNQPPSTKKLPLNPKATVQNSNTVSGNLLKNSENQK